MTMWYNTGTVQVTNGSNTVTGVGTNFTANVRVGDAFKGPDGAWYEVINTPSQTTLAISPNYAGPSATGQAYSITPVQGYNKMLSDSVLVAVRDMQDQSTAAAANAAAALASKNAAKTSETNAKTSETNAKQSETNAHTSDVNSFQNSQASAASAAASLASQNAAKTSETNAKTSETNAKTSETNAKTSETNAANSASSAASQVASQLATKANKGANSDITSLAGLTTPLSLSQGGIGVSDSRALFNEVGVQSATVRYNVQGMYMGWNAASQGEGHFVVNRGGGSGGFSWRSVNAANTVSGPTMTYAYDGTLTVPYLNISGAPLQIASGGTGGTTQAAARTALGLGASAQVQFGGFELFAAAPYIDWHFNNTAADYDVRLINSISGTLALEGRFASYGTWCRAGFAGARGGTVYNMNWTGSAVDFWVDSTYVGSVSLYTSDYRIKKYIKDVSVPSFLDRIDAYRIVNFQKKTFGEVFKGDGTVFQGLVAHEVQEVNPLAASGEKDGVDDEGNPKIQQLDPIALITDLMGAVKELRAQVKDLQSQLAKGE